MLCSDFGTSFASQAIASLSVTSFRPLGSLIGSSKRRDQLIADRSRLGRRLWPVLGLFAADLLGPQAAPWDVIPVDEL